MTWNITRRKLLQGLGALAASPAVAQELPKRLTAGIGDPDAAEYEVGATGISIGVTGHGDIVALRLGRERVSVPFHAGTFLAECTQAEAATHRTTGAGGVEFRRVFVHDKSGARCLVSDRFLPANSSIRWEVEVVGSGDPWTTPIETRMSWLNASTASFWTAWDRPPEPRSHPHLEDALDAAIDAFERNMNLSDLVAASSKLRDSWPTDPWSDPLVPAAFADLNLRYGGYFGAHNAFSVPIATILDAAADRGLSLVQSPETSLLDMKLITSTLGDVRLARRNYRISSSTPVSIAMDLVAHAADWRGGLGWMADRYPNYFEPPNPSAYKLDGCGSYANNNGDLDTNKLKKMAYSVNWNARFDWPFLGMSIPPVQPDVTWTSWYKKPESLAQMSRYDETMEQSGFHVLEYFNTTEGGNYIADTPPPRKAKVDSELWRDASDFIDYQIPSAVVRDREGRILYSHWFGNVVLDSAEPCWRESLLEQARTLTKELPHSSGICIDTTNWLTVYNPHRDDGVSWIDGAPARSLLISWRETLRKLAPILHQAGKLIYANTLVARIDACECLDGFYDENGDFPSSLNLCAFMAVHKPAIAWTRNVDTLRPDPDAVFQRHLHLGVFPTAPLPGADHTIREDPWADQSYLDYGPLLAAIRGKRWVLKPHVIAVSDAAAHANLFQVPGGYAIPITFAGSVSEVTVTLKNLLAPGEQIRSITVLHPGEAKPSPLRWRSSGQEVRITVPVQRGCALVKLDCAPVAAHGPERS